MTKKMEPIRPALEKNYALQPHKPSQFSNTVFQPEGGGGGGGGGEVIMKMENFKKISSVICQLPATGVTAPPPPPPPNEAG